MSVAGIINIRGDTAELLSKYDEFMRRLGASPVKGPPGAIAHYCLAIRDAIQIVSINKSCEQLKSNQDQPEFVEAVRYLVGNDPLKVDVWQVHNIIHWSAGVA